MKAYNFVGIKYGVRSIRTVWGQRIAASRRAVNMTQVQLAGALGVTQQLVSKWERGLIAPRDDRRIKLARILGVRPDDLFAYEPNGGEEAA